MSLTYLYVLVESSGESCKIGVSVNPWQRAQALKKSFDYSSSLMISIPSSSATVVERFIHKVLADISIARERGDGYTEWFHTSAKDKAVNIINAFKSSLLVGEWEVMDREKFDRERAARKIVQPKRRPFMIRLSQDQEDRMLVHAARHKIKKPTTMVQVLFEEGLALMDGQLVDAAKSREGRE